MWFKKASPRRQAIREDLAESVSPRAWWKRGTGFIFVVAGVFFVAACLAQFWPGDPLPYREGELAPTDLRAPVEFSMVDMARTRQMQDAVRATSPPVLVGNQEVFDLVHNQLRSLKGDVANVHTVAQLPPQVLARFPALSDAQIAWLQSVDEATYDSMMRLFLNRGLGQIPLVTAADRDAVQAKNSRDVQLTMSPTLPDALVGARMADVFAVDGKVDPAARDVVRQAVDDNFSPTMAAPITNFIMNLREPTFSYSPKLTAALADREAAKIMPTMPPIAEGHVIVPAGKTITADDYQVLREAQIAWQQHMWKEHPWAGWLSRLGQALIVLILTAAGTLYISRMAHLKISARRAWAVCGLLLATLLVAKLIVTILPQTLYCMGILPTLLTAIILVIAYNQRFALGVGGMHALLITLTLGQNIDFFLTMLAGVTVFAFGLGEIRTRGKLIEVGVVASAVVFGTVWAIGLARMVGSTWLPWSGGSAIMDTQWVATQSLWGAFAGAGASMVALFILPPVERVFKITTAMTLLELCDANKPLLQRLSQEAPGTFNHSLTVGIMAEAAGNAVGANGLLCRVGAYYHDVGKLSKPMYFIENQAAGHPNRHDKLSPAMSLLIIVGHVKDGIELAREYGLPWVIHQFIAQHHGTTLVEYFFHAARKRAEEQEARGGVAQAVSDTEFRYPGPRPQTREAAIVMICDGCESIVRSIEEPTPGRIETAVHNLIMKRLMDGQFSECDLTLRDLSIIEETLVRTLAGIHHGRVAYPARSEPEGGVSDVGLSQPA